MNPQSNEARKWRDEAKIFGCLFLILDEFEEV